jgi:hypothetical protein
MSISPTSVIDFTTYQDLCLSLETYQSELQAKGCILTNDGMSVLFAQQNAIVPLHLDKDDTEDILRTIELCKSTFVCRVPKDYYTCKDAINKSYNSYVLKGFIEDLILDQDLPPWYMSNGVFCFIMHMAGFTAQLLSFVTKNPCFNIQDP